MREGLTRGCVPHLGERGADTPACATLLGEKSPPVTSAGDKATGATCSASEGSLSSLPKEMLEAARSGVSEQKGGILFPSKSIASL